ncbi:ribbon-helix-helix domain-containing protein [Salinarimonas chemoclinalis]|uniref:ribbon-helix-helix domain-containing protein n=1 Tax=Salinarimonas chemoclinalis TaxID=3241599 RepID=UPI0035577660
MTDQPTTSPAAVRVELSQEMLRDIEDSVEAGKYRSVEEAVVDAVRLWQRERADRQERLEAIKAEISRSIDDPRPSLSGEEVDAYLEALLREVDERVADADLGR